MESQDVDMFTLGVGTYQINIPIFGLCDEMKKSVILSSIPFWFIALREINFEDLPTFFVFIFVLICLQKIFSHDPFQAIPQYNFLSNFSTTIFGATGIYLVIALASSFLKTVSLYWKLYLMGTSILFLILTYWQSIMIQYIWDNLGKFLSWMTSSEALDAMGDSVYANRHQTMNGRREQGTRDMSQTTETPPPRHTPRYIPTFYGHSLRRTTLPNRPTLRCVSSCHQ